jgi:choline transport protein
MLVGSLSATGSTIGSDSSVHLSEELQEAAWVLPRSMVTSAAVNYTLAFLMLISKSRNAGLEKGCTTLTMSTRQPSLLPKVETSNSSLQPHTFNRMYKS